MIHDKFVNELQRARTRPDVAQLIFDLDDYYRFHLDIVSGEENYERWNDGNFSRVMDAHYDDPERGLAYLALAMSRYDDTSLLGVLSAGLLEDLLQDPTPDMLERIITEARRTPRFRWMLSGVWLHSIAERARAAVERAVGAMTLEQPLPPAPI